MRPHLPALATGLVLASSLALPLAAQPGGALRDGVGVVIEQAPDGPPQPERAGGVDERALRYYASQYDYAAVDEEIARLQALHPDWEPPRDLFGGPAAPAAGLDESGLWAAYDRGDFAAVRRDIEVLRRLNPAWQPPQKLLDLMAAAESRAAMKEASAAGDWRRVLEIAQQNPGVVSADPAFIENLWMAAEAHHHLGEADQAYALYRTVWAEGAAADLRLSTLQKALANRDDALLKPLLQLEAEQSHDPAEEARFDQIRRDFAGGGGGRPSGQSRLGLALARVSSGDVTAAELAEVEQAATTYRDGDAAQVLGWYYYDRDGFADAERWFEQSLAWQPAAAAAEGLARTLMATGETERAEEVAREWSGRDPKLRAVLADLKGQSVAQNGSPRERLAATSRQIQAEGRPDPGLLVAHGWALYDLERTSEAAEAFERARAGAGSRAALRSQALYGLAHAQITRGLTQEARALLRDDALSGEQRAEVEALLVQREAVDAYQAGRYQESLQLVRQLQARAPEDVSLAALEAWNLLELGQVSEARAIFAELHASFPTAETRRGLKAVEQRQYPASTWM